MNNTNITKQNHNNNGGNGSFRILTAFEALENAIRPKLAITVVNAALYQDNARVHYVENGWQHKNCKIRLESLNEFVLDTYKSNELCDVTLYYYIEENINAVCQAYINAGREIIAL